MSFPLHGLGLGKALGERPGIICAAASAAATCASVVAVGGCGTARRGDRCPKRSGRGEHRIPHRVSAGPRPEGEADARDAVPAPLPRSRTSSRRAGSMSFSETNALLNAPPPSASPPLAASDGNLDARSLMVNTERWSGQKADERASPSQQPRAPRRSERPAPRCAAQDHQRGRRLHTRRRVTTGGNVQRLERGQQKDSATAEERTAEGQRHSRRTDSKGRRRSRRTDRKGRRRSRHSRGTAPQQRDSTTAEGQRHSRGLCSDRFDERARALHPKRGHVVVLKWGRFGSVRV